MSSVGRKRRAGLREANGKPQRPKGYDRVRLDLSRADAMLETVLQQPHRLGNRDQRCESALGRFFLRKGALRRELYDAAQDYANLKRMWRAAKGAPTNLRLEGAGGDASPDSVKQWGAMIGRIEIAIARANRAALGPLIWLAIDGIDTPPCRDADVIDGLMAAAVELGFLKAGVGAFNEGGAT